MKRNSVYILTTLLIILVVSIISFNDGIAYSGITNINEICYTKGLLPHPEIIVRYDLHGGTGTGETRFTVTPVKAEYLPTPTRAGYTFEGWYMNANYTALFYVEAPSKIESARMDDGVTRTVKCFKRVTSEAHAKWAIDCPKQTDIPVQYASNGGSSVPSSTRTAVERAYRNNMMPKPTREGYNFLGWYVNPELTMEFNGSNFVVYSGSGGGCTQSFTSLYAKWGLKRDDPETHDNTCPNVPSYTVYFESNGGTYISERTTHPSSENLGFTFPTPSRNGYRFAGWYK